jgi:hypothetical protein
VGGASTTGFLGVNHEGVNFLPIKESGSEVMLARDASFLLGLWGIKVLRSAEMSLRSSRALSDRGVWDLDVVLLMKEDGLGLFH